MSSPSCHSSLNSLDNLQYQFCAGGLLPYTNISCQWASEAVSWSSLPKRCCCVSQKAYPGAPAFPRDEALPRLSVLLGCSWWAGATVLVSDLAVMLAGIWARISFHGQVPNLEESWWTSERRGLGHVQRQTPGHGVVPVPWVGPSAVQAPPCSALRHGCGAGELRPPGKKLGRWVLREGVTSVSFCVNFGSGFGNDFPWFNCSDNCLFTVSIYRAFIEANQTYALCHCHGVRKVADTSSPTLPFIVQKLFWRNWKGLPASCIVLPGSA